MHGLLPVIISSYHELVLGICLQSIAGLQMLVSDFMSIPSRVVVVAVEAQCTLHHLVCGNPFTRAGQCCREQNHYNGSELGITSLGLPEEPLVNEEGHRWDKGSAAIAPAIARAPDRSRQRQVWAGGLGCRLIVFQKFQRLWRLWRL